MPLTQAFIPLLLLLMATSSDGQTPAPLVYPHEASFRRAATKQVIPAYPEASLAQKVEGVVVLRVTSAPDGHIEDVVVLQAPDEQIAAATEAAVQEWRVPAIQPSAQQDALPRSMQAKLTFYFQIENGRGVVRNPEQVPGNEDVFAAWNQPAAKQGAPGPPSQGPAIVRPGGAAREIDETEFARLIVDASTVVLDVRDRELFSSGAHDRAGNIPADEVLTRSRAELPITATIVIDCSRTETFRCHAAHGSLRQRGFEKVSIFLP